MRWNTPARIYLSCLSTALYDKFRHSGDISDKVIGSIDHMVPNWRDFCDPGTTDDALFQRGNKSRIANPKYAGEDPAVNEAKQPYWATAQYDAMRLICSFKFSDKDLVAESQAVVEEEEEVEIKDIRGLCDAFQKDQVPACLWVKGMSESEWDFKDLPYEGMYTPRRMEKSPEEVKEILEVLKYSKDNYHDFNDGFQRTLRMIIHAYKRRFAKQEEEK